eukprot:CAMPEP_0173392992 /NCGR_PEP_ID=MMETSP1356-20130122/21852_1 /TAXON_ID=77927 ORGANISM="Hemiselmis virescens, Strain PCC157" /NCGR_SAMPLE_ID=MMETSP1356 /ASSEMBLY_ACC=CAM_ASM_000847 /LENGTH=122 /DNA_ID=CAMNT_0014350939 /DNA_START=360 /DNA_END=724 /DNA_ORIENTATION=+
MGSCAFRRRGDIVPVSFQPKPAHQPDGLGAAPVQASEDEARSLASTTANNSPNMNPYELNGDAQQQEQQGTGADGSPHHAHQNVAQTHSFSMDVEGAPAQAFEEGQAQAMAPWEMIPSSAAA